MDLCFLQKEYARYKQVKGWKQLVVYKSGIHALGLYTSLFIPRGAMVFTSYYININMLFAIFVSVFFIKSLFLFANGYMF